MMKFDGKLTQLLKGGGIAIKDISVAAAMAMIVEKFMDGDHDKSAEVNPKSLGKIIGMHYHKRFLSFRLDDELATYIAKGLVSVPKRAAFLAIFDSLEPHQKAAIKKIMVMFNTDEERAKFISDLAEEDNAKQVLLTIGLIRGDNATVQHWLKENGERLLELLGSATPLAAVTSILGGLNTACDKGGEQLEKSATDMRRWLDDRKAKRTARR